MQSIRSRMFFKVSVLKNFANFTGKHLCWSLSLSTLQAFRRCSSKQVFLKILQFHWKTPMLESLLNKVAGLKAWNFIKKRLQHRYFPMKLAKFWRTLFLQNISGGCFWKLNCFSSFYYHDLAKLSQRNILISFLAAFSHLRAAVQFTN